MSLKFENLVYPKHHARSWNFNNKKDKHSPQLLIRKKYNAKTKKGGYKFDKIQFFLILDIHKHKNTACSGEHIAHSLIIELQKLFLLLCLLK